VDPGVGVLDHLAEVLRRHRLRPAAVLLTHGHLDHVYSVTPLCGAGVPALIHRDDAARLRDPFATFGAAMRAMLQREFGALVWKEPDEVRVLTDRQRIEMGGLAVDVVHAPGHTEGSVLFEVPGGAPDGADLCLSGDVLFRGSIGRTDLPGGDHQAMLRSLRDAILPLPDSTVVLPGHGPATTIGAERHTNPYLLHVTA
jgi:glyoxylase-like metal-dependent hydrolase (beta-lactamase superfamily II)